LSERVQIQESECPCVYCQRRCSWKDCSKRVDLDS